ncbi:unnamed protein product, partial [Brenthis ino]
MFAVETTSAQTKNIINKTKYIKNQTPMADRLDRNYFGVDQDYYEKIPLLINDLQESYTDLLDVPVPLSKKKYRSTIDYFRPTTSTVTNKFIRRTSPRPFIFEYKSPYPMPFSKTTTNSKLWLDHYRNNQRLKNLRDVIKYLEKTLNAKFSDFYMPSDEEMAFSELYVRPVRNDNINSGVGSDYVHQKLEKDRLRQNHYIDPLFGFKPDSPGDINLLADGLRFAPSVKSLDEINMNVPIDSAPGNEHTNCRYGRCFQYNRNIPKKYFTPNSEGFRSTPLSILNNKPNVFYSHMPNYFSTPKFRQPSPEIKNELDKIYITTSRPILFQFRRKSNLPIRRNSHRNKSPRILDETKKVYFSSSFSYDQNDTISSSNVYSSSIEDKILTDLSTSRTDRESPNLKLQDTLERDFITNIPKVNLPRVEDYHIGSSGVITIGTSAPQTYSIVTPVMPLRPNTESITNPPDIIKFSPEDAKIPDQYLNLGISNLDEVTESDTLWSNFETSKISNEETEAKTLIVKLRNMIETTTKDSSNEPNQNEFVATTEEGTESTTWTYVPTINGHYRNLKNKTLILLQENSEKYRKKRLENLLSIRNSTYVPMYVEIIRNRNATMNGDNN